MKKLGLLLLLLGGCAQTLPSVRQASFDHECPPERIQVLRYGPNGNTVELDVCGEQKRYQKVGGGIGINWRENSSKE